MGGVNVPVLVTSPLKVDFVVPVTVKVIVSFAAKVVMVSLILPVPFVVNVELWFADDAVQLSDEKIFDKLASVNTEFAIACEPVLATVMV